LANVVRTQTAARGHLLGTFAASWLTWSRSAPSARPARMWLSSKASGNNPRSNTNSDRKNLSRSLLPTTAATGAPRFHVFEARLRRRRPVLGGTATAPGSLQCVRRAGAGRADPSYLLAPACPKMPPMFTKFLSMTEASFCSTKTVLSSQSWLAGEAKATSGDKR